MIVFTRIRYFCFLFYFEYAILNNTNKNDTIREKNLPLRQKTNLEWLFLLIYGRILEKAYLSIFLQENSIQIDFFFIYLQFSANASPLQLSKTENWLKSIFAQEKGKLSSIIMTHESEIFSKYINTSKESTKWIEKNECLFHEWKVLGSLFSLNVNISKIQPIFLMGIIES